MTPEQKLEIFKQINSYADKVLKDVDPEMVPISIQLDKLMPEMKKAANKYKITPQEVFVIYMDMNAVNQKAAEEEMKDKLNIDDEEALNKQLDTVDFEMDF